VCIEKKRAKRILILSFNIHLKSFSVRVTPSYIDVKKKEEDEKPMAHLTIVTKRLCVCVCLSLELAQIIDFTQSCLIDISASVRFFCCYLFFSLFFFFLHSRDLALVLLANVSEENVKNGCSNCFSMCVCVRLEKLKAIFFSHRFFTLRALSLSLSVQELIM
jgi:hypothetical protein